MGCGCGKGKNAALTTHQVRYSDGSVRNYLSAAEANAAVNASQRTANPGTYTPPK